jgi:hypothetical protein
MTARDRHVGPEHGFTSQQAGLDEGRLPFSLPPVLFYMDHHYTKTNDGDE